MEDSKDSSPSAAFEQHIVLDQSPSEHIQLASDEDESREPQSVDERIELGDRYRGRSLELTLFAEGLLTVQASRRGQSQPSQLIDLRYLDPNPALITRIAARTLRAAGALAGVALLGTLASVTTELASGLLPWMLLPSGGAALALLGALQWSWRDYTFVTEHGRAPVLRLRARVGTLRRHRSAAARLSAAIRRAATDAPEAKTLRLKREMREHYRLQSDGIISGVECSRSTTRILAHFG